MSKKPSPTHLFQRGERDGDRDKPGASDRIRADIEAFLQRGGTIDVLGTTRTLSRIGQPPVDATAAPDATDAPAAAKRR